MTSATTKRSVESVWRGNLHCEVTAGNFVLAVDEPASVGGTDRGPQPTELFLASVASCFTLAIAFSAKKLGLDLRQLSVTATGIYDGPRFREIRIAPRIGCDPAQIATLVRRAEAVCYVTNTLRSQLDIVVEAEAVPDQ